MRICYLGRSIKQEKAHFIFRLQPASPVNEKQSLPRHAPSWQPISSLSSSHQSHPAISLSLLQFNKHQQAVAMWEHLSLDLLAHVFSFLPPDSVARAMAACKHWLECARSRSPPSCQPPWLVALPARAARGRPSCYAHDSALNRWHALPLDFFPCPLRLVAPVGSSLLCKLAASSDLRLVLLNPFTRQLRNLPDLTMPRRNPAVGIVVRSEDATNDSSSSFSVIVAGGASGSCYEPTVEMYDAGPGGWSLVGPMPVEFAVRLTVWTPNESVHALDGAMYWMTSARAYSVMGFDLGRRAWREVKAPMADRLEWAALVRRPSGKLGLVGGDGDGQGTVWELIEEDKWVAVGRVPAELGRRFWGRSKSAATRCVGGEEAVYLFRDLGSEMLVWRESSSSQIKKKKQGEETWEWRLVHGRCCMPNIPIKAALLHPTLSRSSFPASL
ncbi:hypothetical protein B296_00012175 [Ensete ventricosum]|uniref:F-box domain-containing protein n=2 Tax=Ensete ventricosum TaxID=4639 RepID=A0A427ANR5_ENSVE|nr:hypothetical protein B296_00012175 [Ensete ventricosum]